MDSFKQILSFMKHMVLNSTSSDLRFYLQSLVDIGVISSEYYHSLLSESDSEDLCRKISLSLLENPDDCHALFSPVCEEEEMPTIYGTRVIDDSTPDMQCSHNKISKSRMPPHVSVQEAELKALTEACRVTEVDDLSILNSTESYLKLLNSDIDVACESQEADADDFEDISLNFQDCKELFTDDVVSTLRTVDISDIEELVNYTNGDGNNCMDELLSSLSKPEECAEEPENKRARKTCPSIKSPRKPRQRRKKKDTTALHERYTGNEIPIPLSTTNLPFLFTSAEPFVGAGNSYHPCPFSVVPDSTLQIKIIICPAPAPGPALSCVSTLPPIPVPEHQTLPTNTSVPPSPDRNGSCSPFAPSAADLPNSPDAAAMCHFPSMEIDTGITDKWKQTQVHPVPQENIKHKLVNSFIEAQKQLYHSKFALERECLYTETVLVNSRINLETGKVGTKTAERELLNYDSTEKETETLELLKLFEDKDRKEMETKTIALLGQSGMGKTVLAKKICHEWSAEKFNQFSFVFYFECKQLDACKQYSFKDFLFKLSSCAEEKSLDVYQYVLRNPEKVLLIFDGFDEFQDSESLLQGSFTTSPSKTNKVKDLFTGLFQKKLLRGCTLLITARLREKLNQYLGKVDKIIEVMGFSPTQVEWYIKEYFKERPDFSNALEWIKDYHYVFSYCYIPFMCKTMCLFAEENLETRNKELPLSLAALFDDLFKKNLLVPATCFGERTSVQNCTVDLACLDFESDKKMEAERQTQKLPTDTGNTMERTPSNTLLQNFSTALHILGGRNGRNLLRYISCDPKKRRNEDMVRRFLIGLTFDDSGNLDLKFSDPAKKQKKLSEYFQALQLSALCPRRLLEVLHCVHETDNPYLMRRLAVTLSKELSFVDTRLTPPDVFVLTEVLKKSKAKLSLDLRKTSIDQKGLKELVRLKSVKSFRASLSDTVNLWKTLLADGQNILLKKCIRKFTLQPFKVESMKDVADLTALVDIQNDICKCSPDSSLDIKEIPAVKNLNSLMLGLGKKHGQDGFLKLVEILPKLPALQKLDLYNLTENYIGDKGVEKLAEKIPELRCLQTLDLSQNNITGVGAKKLAAALPSLHSLQTLSLYNNIVCDTGAEELANILPDMTSLEALHLDCNIITCTGAEQLVASLQKCPKMKKLRMYSTLIPHATLQRFQLRDPRIGCVSIG